MIKESLFRRLLKKLGIIKERKATDEEIASMCRKAVQTGVCPNNCDVCAWQILRR